MLSYLQIDAHGPSYQPYIIWKRKKPKAICLCTEFLISCGRSGSFQDKCSRETGFTAYYANGKNLSLVHSKFDL